MMFLVSAVVHLPASLVVRWLALPPNVLLQGVTGTIWRGQIKNVSIDSVDVGKGSWQLTLRHLLQGKLGAEVRFGEQSSIQMRAKGQVVASLSSIHLIQFSVMLPANALMPLIPSPVLTNLAGHISFTIDEYQYQFHGERYCERLNGQAHWQDAELSLVATPLNLASVHLNLSCVQHQIVLESEQKSEHLSSQLSATFSAPHRFALTGWFTPEHSFPQSFTASLAWFSEPDAKNRYRLNYNGRW
jgi:general secretion pathway protein N